MPPATVLTGSPAISVQLYRRGQPAFDLSPFLTALNCDKDMTQSAGQWDAEVQYTSDWTAPLLATTTPLDYVTITAATSAGSPPYTMRGFVDTILDNRAIDQSGQPTRRIQLNGRDFGGRLQDFSIYYPLSTADIPAASLSLFSFALKYGLTQSALNLSPNTFWAQVYSKIIMTAFLDPMQRLNPAIDRLQQHLAIPAQYGFDTLSINSFMGSLDDLLKQYESPPWGEYFVRDDDDAPRLYQRAAPLLDYLGNWAWGSAAPVEDMRFTLIPAAEVISQSLAKNASDVYTYFLTTTDSLALDPSLTIAAGLAMGNGNPYYDAVRGDYYGYIPLEPSSPWIPLDPLHGTPAAGQAALNLTVNMNQWLIACYGHGEYMRSGTMTTRGVQGARVGDYVYIESTGEVAYCQALGIAWQEGQALQSSYQLIRAQAGSGRTPLPVGAYAAPVWNPPTDPIPPPQAGASAPPPPPSPLPPGGAS